MLFIHRSGALKPLLFVLLLLLGCRSERVAFRFPSGAHGLPTTVEVPLPVAGPATGPAAHPVAKPLPARLRVLGRPWAHRPAARAHHSPAQLRPAYLCKPKKPEARPESVPLASHPSGYRFSNALFVGGFVVALLGVFAAFAMPTLGLGILVFFGGLLLGLIITTIGFVTGYGKGPGGMH